MFNDYGPSSPTLASRSPVIIPMRSTMYAKSMAVPRLRERLPDARSRNLAPGLCTPRQGHGHDNQTRYLSSHSGTATVALFLLRLRSRSSCSVIRIDSPHPLLQVSACVRRRGTAINPRRNAGVRTRDLPVPNGARFLLRHIPKAEKSASFFVLQTSWLHDNTFRCECKLIGVSPETRPFFNYAPSRRHRKPRGLHRPRGFRSSLCVSTVTS